MTNNHKKNQVVKAFDDRRNVAILADKEEALAFCVNNFFEIASKTLETQKQFSVALSGGSTPKAIFQRIAASPARDNIDWKRVLLFWSDERCVPPNDPESNYHMAMANGFLSLPIPPENIFRMKAEEDPTHQAKEYQQQIVDTLGGEPFDFVMLGVGEDGHTASLFPKTHALHAPGHLVAANFVPQKDVWRMTLTFDCINKARHVVVYALGKEKAPIIRRIFNDEYDPDSLPAQRVGTPSHKALWIMDAAAAALLSQQANI